MENIQVLLHSFNRYIAIAICISYILIDGLYAYYTYSVVAKNPLRSANVWAFMHILLAFGVLNYTENRLYVFPVVVGSRIWTYIVVTYQLRNKK